MFCVISPFAVDPNASFFLCLKETFEKKTSIFLPVVQVFLLTLLKISPLAQFYSVFFFFFWLSLDLCGIVCQSEPLVLTLSCLDTP